MSLAPVIVFAYNRPDLLNSTLDWLSKNYLADQSEVYVFCDGAKNGASQEQIDRVQSARQVAREWAQRGLFKDVHITQRETNLGLGTSIITGVSEIISQYGKCIVLEDDLQTSPRFLDYMNQCLTHYENRKSVFSISGLSRPRPERFFPKDYPYDVYVSLTHHPTGWATCGDAEVAFQTLLEDQHIQCAFKRAGNEMWDQLLLCKQSGRNIWSVLFYLAHFENHAVSICPIVSYIEHIGWGADSTNCPGDGAAWKHERLAENKDIRFLDILYEDSRIINSWYSFRFGKPRPLLGKMINAFGRRFKNKDEYYLKGKVYCE